MRILLLNQVFYPDVAATAQHAHDLGRHLVQQGHDVAVIASRAFYGQKGAVLARRETVDGVEIHRVGRSLFGKAGILGRAIDFAIFYVAAAVKALTIPRADVVICLTTPPYLALLGWLLKILRRSKSVYWLMDLYPDVLIAGGLLKPTSLSARMLERISRFCLRRADRVVVLGRCMRERVEDKDIDAQRIVHISVWADQEEVSPIAPQQNPYRQQWGLDTELIVMYSGNFGLVHDVETMCAAAERLRDRVDIGFAFVGGGKRKAEVESFVRDHHVDAHLEPYQPRERLDSLLTCADVHLVSLKSGYEGIVVPSKLYGIMAAAKPAIFIGPAASEVARVIDEQDCGMAVRPGDVEGLVKAILDLADNPQRMQRMGLNGRRAIQQRYDRRHACDAWQQLLEDVAHRRDQAEPKRAPAQGSEDRMVEH